MPAAVDKKRKKTESGKPSPAKKRKLDASPKKNASKAGAKTPKSSTKAKAVTPKVKKAATASKVQKSSTKGTKAKQTDTKAKAAGKNAKKDTNIKKADSGKKAVKSKPASKATSTSKSSIKGKATPKKEVKKAAKVKPVQKKNEKAKASPAKKPTATKTKVANTKAKTAQLTVAKAKLKAVKTLAKPKAQKSRQEPAKPKAVTKLKPEVKKRPVKATEKSKIQSPSKLVKREKQNTTDKSKDNEKANTPKPKQLEEKESKKTSEKENVTSNKRKVISDTESVDTPRKKRLITPNKRYADFETDSPTKRISELRAFVQDKKKSPATPKPESPEKSVKRGTAALKLETTPVKKSLKSTEVEESPSKKSPEVKVIKTSEMKPAEKLLKKMQKKLEQEAKAAFAKPKQSPNKDTAKTKITKVVTYNKPAGSKTETKLFTKVKSKPAVIVKKKPAASPQKAVKEATKVAPSPKKVREQKKDDRKIQTKFLFQKDVRQGDDTNTNSWITGIDIFKSGEIVLIDMSNKKIKLFTANFEYMSQAKLDTTPQDISISPLDAGMAYFTKPFSKEGIQKVCLSDGQLTLKDSFLTNGTNRGVKCLKSGILTSVQNGRYHDLDINLFKIDLLDYKGNVLKSVSVDQSGVRLFKLPLYFTVSNNEKQIVVSDCIRNNSYIVSLDMSGKIKFKFTGVQNNPITPRGLTNDDEDNIYVTEWERHQVYVLTPAGKRLQLLLDHTEQLKEGHDGLKKPYQLCYYKHEGKGRLIVSQESCNTIKVFQIGPKQIEQSGTSEVKAAVPGTAKSETRVAVVKPVSKTVLEVEKPAEEKPEEGKPVDEKPAEQEKSMEQEPEEEEPVEEEPAEPSANQKSPIKVIPIADATSILTKEHAYTTLSPSAEKKGPAVIEDLPSDPMEEEGSGEMSSFVDSIISNLNNHDPQSLQNVAQSEVVISEQSI